jgi:hypothetical protein
MASNYKHKMESISSSCKLPSVYKPLITIINIINLFNPWIHWQSISKYYYSYSELKIFIDFQKQPMVLKGLILSSIFFVLKFFFVKIIEGEKI